MTKWDAIVVGCGPAGSTAGADLAAQGLRVLGLERQAFPRYHIGESLTGTVGNYLREIGLEERMNECSFPVKYGVKVVGREARNDFFVATAPAPTWQVRRDEFDDMLLGHARKQGLETEIGTVSEVLRDGERVVGVRYVDAEGQTQEAQSDFLVDATGMSTLLAREGVAGTRKQDVYSDQIAFFSQIEGCERDPGLMHDITMIFYNEPHHWAWFIPLDADRVSVGIVITGETYRAHQTELKAAGRPVPEGIYDWGLEAINPELARRCAGKPRSEVVRVTRDYSYEIAPFAGDGWICVGDSHRFVDPIFSFGVSIAVQEGQMAAAAIESALQSGDYRASFSEYQRRCKLGQDAVYDVIRYFWRFPAFFGVQAQGRYREDIMRLFAGACYDEEPLAGLEMMRESLARTSSAA